MKNIIIPILLISLLLTGCSSTPQKSKSFFTQEQQIELSNIVDSHLTEQDWVNIQQKLSEVRKIFDYDLGFDIENDYYKDLRAFELLFSVVQDNPKLSKELSEFLL